MHAATLGLYCHSSYHSSLVNIEHFLRQWVIRAGASVALSKGFVRDLVTEIAPPSVRFTNSWRPT
jgi:hypothetical protein